MFLGLFKKKDAPDTPVPVPKANGTPQKGGQPEKKGGGVSIQSLFNNNKFVALFSLVCAVLLWFTVCMQQTTDFNDTVSNVPVTVSYENSMAQDLGLELIGDIKTTVDVHVTGTRYAITSLDADDFNARVSLSSVTKAGTYTLSIEVISKASSSDYTITSWSPAEVELTFDKIISRTLPLEIITPNLTAAEGYLMETAYGDFDYITVTGPQTEVNKISRCVVNIPTEQELSETLTTTGTVTLVDEMGAAVSSENIEYDHNTVTVTVPIYKTKELPLNVEFVNVPRGFPIEQLGYTLSRNSILVASPSETIDNVDAITVGPIDFREIDIGTELTLDITLNAGLKNVENVTSVTVTFPTYGLSARTLDLNNFVFENLPSGYDITTLSDSIENIRVVGDSSIIADLTQEDLVGIIDLSQYSLSRGRYTVSVKVYVQGKVLAWAVGEYSVSIDVVPKEVVSDTGN